MMGHKEIRARNDDNSKGKEGGESDSSVITLNYERFLQEKVQIFFCQGRLEADW